MLILLDSNRSGIKPGALQDSYVLVQDDAAGLGRFQVLDANWQVCTQDPAPGDVMPISTLVTLGAVKLDETC